MADVAGEQVFVHPERPRPDAIDPVGNREVLTKPSGGLWTSSYREGSCAWVEWCAREQWWPHERDALRSWVLTPADDVTVYTINAMSDLRKLLEAHPRDDGPLVGIRETPDWEELVATTEYDGVRVTARGVADTRLTRPSLYEWDCESTVWFRWCFETVERVPFDDLLEHATV